MVYIHVHSIHSARMSDTSFHTYLRGESVHLCEVNGHENVAHLSITEFDEGYAGFSCFTCIVMMG